MHSLPVSLLVKAMDGLSMRAIVTAQNIANANSPGYRPLAVDFEGMLRSAAGEGLAAVNAVRPKIVPELDSEGHATMRLDLEMATATTTAGRYGALAEILSRQLENEALAASAWR